MFFLNCVAAFVFPSVFLVEIYFPGVPNDGHQDSAVPLFQVVLMVMLLAMDGTMLGSSTLPL